MEEECFLWGKDCLESIIIHVCIICPIHGEFWQTPNNHLFGAGCPTCPQSNPEGKIRHFLIKNNIKFEP